LSALETFDFLTIFYYDMNMPINEEFIEMYVLMCRTISKPDRLKILKAIGRGKKNVSTLHKELNIPMSGLSNHLNDLYRSGVLGKEKKGNYVYYYLTEPKLIKSISQMQEIIKNITGRLANRQS